MRPCHMPTTSLCQCRYSHPCGHTPKSTPSTTEASLLLSSMLSSMYLSGVIMWDQHVMNEGRGRVGGVSQEKLKLKILNYKNIVQKSHQHVSLFYWVRGLLDAHSLVDITFLFYKKNEKCIKNSKPRSSIFCYRINRKLNLLCKMFFSKYYFKC